MESPTLLLILGNQLFSPAHLPSPETRIFMAEDLGLCTYEKHHQQKIVLFLAAMRAYADELRAAGYDVYYVALDPADTRSYEDKLASVLEENVVAEVLHFEIEDKAMEERIVAFADAQKLTRTELRSPMFTCTRQDFAAWNRGHKRPFMQEFYKFQRKRLGILVDADGNPEGGKWSYDADNRKRLPKKIVPPEIPWPEPDRHVDTVVSLVESSFADHPGRADEFCWPTTRVQAKRWLDDFIEQRLRDFGPYEDAMTSRSPTVFHSLLSPYLNMGLLTPAEVVARVIEAAEVAPLQSVEGFVRQVIGWREFVRGIYRGYSETQETTNFFGHERKLADSWYSGTTGILPLDDTIRTAQAYGWTHHIARLMVAGNLMTLCEIRPQAAHRWFMEMFIDSSEWVMGPNVYGMGLFSDGGIFATKPYICGSNYLQKMSDYPIGDWCDTVDGLYWRFIDRHRRFFSQNPRLALMPRALDRLDPQRRARIFAAAEAFIEQNTTE